jgi:hypothetical protein
MEKNPVEVLVLTFDRLDFEVSLKRCGRLLDAHTFFLSSCLILMSRIDGHRFNHRLGHSLGFFC